MQTREQQARALRFIAQRSGIPPAEWRLEAQPLSGGLEAHGVYAVVARSSRGHELRFIVKELAGATRREAFIYRALAASDLQPLAPRLLGVEEHEDLVSLYLEHIVSGPPWPWCDLQHTRQVLCSLATLHTIGLAEVAANRCNWDYEHELRLQGAALLEVMQQSRPALRDRGVIVPLPLIRRLVEALPALRRSLLSSTRIPATIIHGDVHSGNVRLRREERGQRAVLLDWGRARMGHPFEDVSSWLQSLAFWEPQARRRHDTLLRAYLEARGSCGPPERELRRLYWLSAPRRLAWGGRHAHQPKCRTAR